MVPRPKGGAPKAPSGYGAVAWHEGRGRFEANDESQRNGPLVFWDSSSVPKRWIQEAAATSARHAAEMAKLQDQVAGLTLENDRLKAEVNKIALQLRNKKELGGLNRELEAVSGGNAKAVQEGVSSFRSARELAGHSIPPEGQFMSRRAFAKVLKQHNLLTLQPGAKHEGQHVFHIISAANGGPDHTDNFLYALGGSFNISIGDDLDGFNCVLAGKEKTRRAVKIALEVARDETKQRHIDKRGKAKPTLFSTGRYKSFVHKNPNNPSAIADALYAQGNALLRDLRAAKKQQRADYK